MTKIKGTTLVGILVGSVAFGIILIVALFGTPRKTQEPRVGKFCVDDVTYLYAVGNQKQLTPQLDTNGKPVGCVK